jgi:hypothetical protein
LCRARPEQIADDDEAGGEPMQQRNAAVPCSLKAATAPTSSSPAITARSASSSCACG